MSICLFVHYTVIMLHNRGTENKTHARREAHKQTGRGKLKGEKRKRGKKRERVKTGRTAAQHINHQDDYYGSCHGNILPSPPFSPFLSPSISFCFTLKSIQMHLNASVGTAEMQYVKKSAKQNKRGTNATQDDEKIK